MVDIKKKIRPGAIQLHADEAALLVHYEVQEVSTQEDGQQQVVSSSHATKKITVKSLSERTDLQALAAEIVDKCKLIHPSKTGVVHGLLQQLQRRALGLPLDLPTAAAPPHPAGSRPSTSSSTSSGHATQILQATTGPGFAENLHVPMRPASRAAHVAAAEADPRGGRPASARPQSASRPHTANSSGSSRGSTPQQQQQRQQQHHHHSHLQPPALQQQQQYRLVQASEAFQAYAQALAQSTRPAFLDDLEVYIEGLYEEELHERAAAAGMLCQLFKNSSNMQALLSRETLLSTLARLLREDGPRSLDMATAVAGCFYACSCVKQLHRLLLDNQVGSLLMDLVSLELQRSTAREAQEGPGMSAAAIVAKAAATAAVVSGKPASRQPQQKGDFDQRDYRLLLLVIHQDRFLCVALATLLNLSEEPAVQRKMVKKDMVGLLVGLMNRPHLEVLVLVVGFLRRLCVYAESKARLCAHPAVVNHLVSLLQPGCGEQLQCGVLRLLHNLSFDAALRQPMMAAGLVQQAVPLLDGTRTAPLAAGLLYQLSLEGEARAAFCFCPGGLNRLLDSILRALGPSHAGPSSSSPGGLRTIPELIALAVNVAHSKNVAEWFNTGERLERLAQRAIATQDELAWKLLRNLAVSGGELVAPTLLAHADGMVNILQSHSTGPELFVEVMGTLAAAADAVTGSNEGDSSRSSSSPDNCTLAAGGGSNEGDSSRSSSSPDNCTLAAGGGSNGSSGVAPWRLMQGVSLQDLLALLAGCFQQGGLEDDALLEAVVLLGALAGWVEGDADVAESGLLHLLVDLLPAKRADDEFVLQVCWALRRALMQPASTNALLTHDQVVMYLVDLVQDCCVAVSRVARSCLDVIIDLSEDMAGIIRSLNFEAFNQEWLKLAGPEAQQLMAAAAAWQQQQLQLYIHQQQQAQLQVAATPYTTMVQQECGDAVGPQQQQQQRRGAMSGYYFEQQQGQQEQWADMGLQHQQGAGAYCDDAEVQQGEQQQQQLQWMSWPVGGEEEQTGSGGQQEQGGGVGSSTITRPSIVTAAGQCMVLDFDAFVSDTGAAC